MDKKQTLIVIILSVVVLGGLIVGVIMRNGGAPGFLVQNGGSTEPGENATSTASPLETQGYVPTVPKNATATTPQMSAPAAPNVTEQLGIFNMTVSAKGFSPASITVTQGNLVQIKVTATDGTYDFVMPYSGLSAVIPKGTTQTVAFGATSAGTFAFSCSKDCPTSGKIGGTIIVLPK